MSERSIDSIDPEGPESEWKEQLPAPDRLARTFAAFANGVGGVLWLGITDAGEIVGVEQPRESREALLRAAAELVVPAVQVQVSRVRRDGRTLLAARVDASRERPVRAVLRGGRQRVYVRDGASSRPADAATEKALTRPASAQLDDRTRRLLATLDGKGPLTLPELARAARMGQRATRRAVVTLVGAGLVHGRDGRLSLTPLGHRKTR